MSLKLKSSMFIAILEELFHAMAGVMTVMESVVSSKRGRIF